MNHDEAKKAALEILDSSKVGVLATVKGNKPHTRYMTFFHDGFTLYTATSRKTQKVDELEANPHAHILLGYEGEGVGDTYLEIEGRMAAHDDSQIIEKVWNEHLTGWFSGPDDPNLLILRIHPDRVRLMNKKGQDPVELQMG
ncbi:pyridoxamine 5'-phosphate oxidase family protein [Planococcus salinarum]|uniref:pyridoxamine 5'-phosphate oxidase family protein n=1 Tax=Planococcus salinarum TaxID=622695 RepID=UPI000E3CD20D|nr:pyridoxamine 5'-phosphate oxidase family protein [Planococcus salinarum]TAA73604.1 general stress protein [Planococcus salinarum]